MPVRHRSSGFTLIEILVVISIIALLTALLLPGLQHTKCVTLGTIAKTEVVTLSMALENYIQDESEYPSLPGEPVTAESNHYPALHRALLGEPRPAGPGGRSGPYTRIEQARVAVEDEGAGGYRRATRDELEDEAVAKHFLDPWGRPYVYRPNKGQKRQPHMRNPATADIYSVGEDEVDATAAGSEDGDDIGNW